MTRRTGFRIAAALLGTVVVVLGIELCANVYLYARDGRYIPARQRLAALGNTFTKGLTRERSDCRYVDTLFPHPYVGFVHHGNPPCGLSVNNVGLFGPDFPSERPHDRFVVLLTGGSVASQFAAAGPGGVPYLEAILNRDYTSPTGRPFLLLNGGDGSWHQPQQAILFLLYADAVHAVVTLDGYNERYMVGANVRFEFPTNNFMDVNPLVNASYSYVVKQWLLGRIYGYAAANMVLSRSEAAYIVLARIDAQLQEQLRSAQPTTTINTIFQLPPDWDEERRIAWADGQYRKYIRAMDAIAAQNGALAAHFLQPVPAIGKPLTDEERAVVGDLSYRARYERIMRDVLRLADEGTPIYSLLELFEHNTQTLYADVIHLRQLPDGSSEGYRLIAERMAMLLAQTWQLPRKSLRTGGT